MAAFLAAILLKAYPGNTLRNKRIKVLVNPFGGKGSASKWYHRDIEPVFRAAGCTLSVEHTRYKAHAVEIAQKLDANVFDVVACCSGDGLPHEVFNGLAKQTVATQALKRVAVAQLPCGSGNALSWNLNGTDSPSLAALAVVKGVRTPMDLCAVSQVVDGEEQRYFSFLSQSIGIVAESDLGTEHLRWLGDARFTYGIVSRLFGKTIYPCDIAVDVAVEKSGIKRHCREAGQNHDRIGTQQQKQESPDLIPTAFPTSDHPSKASFDGNTANPLSTLASSITTPLESIPNYTNWTPLTPYPTIGNFYSGCMPLMAASTNFFPGALPSDGLMDLITIDGQISRLTSLKMMMAVEKGKMVEFDEVST